MQNTRQRIVNYLENHQHATASDLSFFLDLTQANIRHHLKILENERHIEVIGQVHPGGRGRPNHLYMLTKRAQENTLDELASALLAVLQREKNTKRRNYKLEEVAKTLAGSQLNLAKSITIQLSNAVQRLNDLNYKAHWEAHASAPQIIFGRCPFAQIINRHPELCQMDSQMLEFLTGEGFVQVEKISRTRHGPVNCRFVLKQD